MYVGKSISLKNRLVSHFSKAAIQLDPWKNQVDLEHIIIYHCNNDADLDIYETYFINKYRPKHNKDKVFISNPTFELPHLEPKTYNFSKERRESSLIPYQESLKKVVSILSQEIISEEDTEYLEATYLLDPSIKLAIDILGTKRINSLRYVKTKINKEIQSRNDQVVKEIKNIVQQNIISEKFYSMKECKLLLRDTYQILNLSINPIGLDILKYKEGIETSRKISGKKVLGYCFI